MSYDCFAEYYDDLTENVDYNTIATYLDTVLKKEGKSLPTVVDLGCGTGSLAQKLAQLGYSVIGLDNSPQMLTIASGKLNGFENTTLIQQRMTRLSLPKPVGAVVSTLDSLNHLSSTKDFQKVVGLVAMSLKQGGYFIFDVNTAYKHQFVLSNNAFLYELDQLFCGWQNLYNPDDGSVEIFLDFFWEQEDGLYQREQEHFHEIIIPPELIISTLEESGFQLVSVHGDYTALPPSPEEERIVYTARKK